LDPLAQRANLCIRITMLLLFFFLAFPRGIRGKLS